MANYVCAVRFDLTECRWVRLTRKNYSDALKFDSVTFNDSILISRRNACNLWLYSIDIDSFSEIPYQFSIYKSKILINGEERLYLIESDKGWIYESEIKNEFVWKKIARSIIDCDLDQIYCSYNKGGFYISALGNDGRVYYKLDLSQNSFIDIACYGKNVAFKRLDGKIEAIECYGQDLKLNFDNASACIQKRSSLFNLVENLEAIEKYNKSNDSVWNYHDKGVALQSLDRHLEALECYNESIGLEPTRNSSFEHKVRIFYDFGRYLEVLELYKKDKDKLIALGAKTKYFEVADSLYDLGRYNEAVECYNEYISFKPEYEYFYIRKADAHHRMGKNLKAEKYFTKAVKLKSDNPLYFCYHADMLYDLGEVAGAIQEFNKAYHLFSLRSNIRDYYDFVDFRYTFNIFIEIEDYLELLKILCNWLESDIEFKAKVEEIKGSNLKNLEIVNEIEEKEKAIKESHSQIIKRAVKCIDIKRTKFIEAVEKMKIEIAECQRKTIDEIIQLRLLLPAQE